MSDFNSEIMDCFNFCDSVFLLQTRDLFSKVKFIPLTFEMGKGNNIIRYNHLSLFKRFIINKTQSYLAVTCYTSRLTFNVK